MSRSAATIVGGLLSGLDRPTATQFSFYLALPTLTAASLFSLLKAADHIHAELRDGVLSVVVPKRPETQPKRVTIQTPERPKS
jgi:undecaprenyl pyrophosphate phosphatase UppP